MLLFSPLSLGPPIHFSVPLIFLTQFLYVPFCWTHTSSCFLSALQLRQVNLVNSHSTTRTTIHCGFISISHKLMCRRMLEVFYFNILFCIEHAQNSVFYLVPVSPCLFSWSYWYGPESVLQCSFSLQFSAVLLHKHWYHIPILPTWVDVTSAFNHLHSRTRIFALHFNHPSGDSFLTTDHPSNLLHLSITSCSFCSSRDILSSILLPRIMGMSCQRDALDETDRRCKYESWGDSTFLRSLGELGKLDSISSVKESTLFWLWMALFRTTSLYSWYSNLAVKRGIHIYTFYSSYSPSASIWRKLCYCFTLGQLNILDHMHLL